MEDALNAANSAPWKGPREIEKIPGLPLSVVHVSGFRPATCTSIRQSKMSQPQSWADEGQLCMALPPQKHETYLSIFVQLPW